MMGMPTLLSCSSKGGAKLNETADSAFELLSLASRNGRVEVLQALLRHGADLNSSSFRKRIGIISLNAHWYRDPWQGE